MEILNIGECLIESLSPDCFGNIARVKLENGGWMFLKQKDLDLIEKFVESLIQAKQKRIHSFDKTNSSFD